MAEWVQKGDSLYKNRSGLKNASEALALYEKGIEVAPHVEAYWKASRAAWWIGDHTATKKEKLKSFQKGIEYSKKGIALDPNSVESHFWLGANYGSYGESRGVLKSLFLVKPIRKEMEEVLRIDPPFEGGGGYRVLGVVDYKVPEFSGGNKKRALERLTKAYDIAPRNPFTNYYLAEYYVLTKKKDLARKHLGLLATLTEADADPADLDMMKKKGEKLAVSLGDKTP